MKSLERKDKNRGILNFGSAWERGYRNETRRGLKEGWRRARSSSNIAGSQSPFKDIIHLQRI